MRPSVPFMIVSRGPALVCANNPAQIGLSLIIVPFTTSVCRPAVQQTLFET